MKIDKVPHDFSVLDPSKVHFTIAAAYMSNKRPFFRHLKMSKNYVQKQFL